MSGSGASRLNCITFDFIERDRVVRAVIELGGARTFVRSHGLRVLQLIRSRYISWYYNFVRIHSALRVTPAKAAGVSDRLWEIDDIVALVEADDPKPVPRSSYKKTEISK